MCSNSSCTFEKKKTVLIFSISCNMMLTQTVGPASQLKLLQQSQFLRQHCLSSIDACDSTNLRCQYSE